MSRPALAFSKTAMPQNLWTVLMRLVGHILFWITAHQLSRNNFHFYWAEYLIGSICLFKNEYHTLQYCHEQRAPVHYKPSYKYSVCLFVYRRFWREIVKLYLLGVTRPPLKISKNISCFDQVCWTCYTSNIPILNMLLKLIWNWRKPKVNLKAEINAIAWFQNEETGYASVY